MNKILDYNRNAKNIFPLASKVDKGISKPEGSVSERIKLRKGMIAEIEEKRRKKHKQWIV